MERKRVFVVATGKTNFGSYPNLRVRTIDADKRVRESDLPKIADVFLIDTKFMSHKVSIQVKQWAGFIGAKYTEVRGVRAVKEELEKLNKENMSTEIVREEHVPEDAATPKEVFQRMVAIGSDVSVIAGKRALCVIAQAPSPQVRDFVGALLPLVKDIPKDPKNQIYARAEVPVSAIWDHMRQMETMKIGGGTTSVNGKDMVLFVATDDGYDKVLPLVKEHLGVDINEDHTAPLWISDPGTKATLFDFIKMGVASGDNLMGVMSPTGACLFLMFGKSDRVKKFAELSREILGKYEKIGAGGFDADRDDPLSVTLEKLEQSENVIATAVLSNDGETRALMTSSSLAKEVAPLMDFIQPQAG
jgi:hypothetical protein